MPRTTPTAAAAPHAPTTKVVKLRPRTRRTRSTTAADNTTARGAVVTALPTTAQVDADDDPLAVRVGDPPQGTVRIELTDGRVLWGTRIRDYRPVFTDEDYAALARCRDELRASAARNHAAALPEAA